MSEKTITDINDMEKAWEVVETEKYNELKTYSEAQFKVVVQLQQEVEKLKAENASLLQAVEGNVPLIGFDVNTYGVSNEQLIAETQLLRLKNKAISEETLTMEDVRKVEILQNVLEKAKKKPSAVPNTDDMADEDLIKIIQINGKK